MQGVDPRRPSRQDTYDLRDQIQDASDYSDMQAHVDSTTNPTYHGISDEEHSVLEDDSDNEDQEMEYAEDDEDGSSDLSIPNESIDFDLVYSLHSFAATVEGQANVVKGDSLFLMDDSNSYWWLVRVLKTQEVGYIPAENIETPFERLARLNKHRNVDLASATEAETAGADERLRVRGTNKSPSPVPPRGASRAKRGVAFTPSLSVHRYPPAVWNEEEEEEEDIEWDDEGYEGEDRGLAEEMLEQQRRAEEMQQRMGTGDRQAGMEVDDGMQWVDEAQARLKQQQQQQGAVAGLRAGTPPSGMSAEQVQSQQRQQQIMEAQEREIQRQQQLEQDRQRQMAQQAQVQNGVRKSPSRERLDQDVRMTDASQQIDPADATETRKLTVTPPVARDERQGVPSAVAKTQEEERKRRVAEEDEEARRKNKGANALGPAVSSGSVSSSGSSGRQGGGKLRKERGDTDDEGGKDKKKKTSMFGGLFTRKKDKKNPSIGSFDSNDAVANRASEDSNRSGSVHSRSTGEGFVSPVTAAASAMQQQQVQQVQPATPKAIPEPKRPAGEASAPLVAAAPTSAGPAIIGTPSTPPQVSQHASQLRQRDQQQQALYQQYLNRSPSSPPEAQPSYGLQSASIFNAPPSAFHSPTNSGSNAGLGVPTPRPRPGSLILTGMSPDLSVIRVFAGKNLQTEATFKTVLLNSSTTSEDLVRQAIQRFRLPGGDDENDYYLTVKQVEGGASAVLRSAEKPLVVFETLTEAATELPKVKRSSVGSISSVASNLSMHPAIRKLPMNDFTDDSAVKFYLNRRNEDGSSEDEFSGLLGDETLVAETSFGSGEAEAHLSPLRSQYLSVGNNVTPERFSSPSYRFALQMVIYPEDLPEDMAFDPLTEAIVPKETLRGRPQSSSSISTSLSQTMRRKVFIFPKNVTVAEVIELGLERFGIPEGVVDGGDEVEDKMSKRRSSSRVRYGLTVDTGNSSERELSPSSKVIDAFSRPPTFRAADRKVNDNKRRSIDSGLLLGNMDDINPDDPFFVLRRAVAYRSSTSRHRLSAPLDEIALQHLHQSRESEAGSSSDPSSPVLEDGKRQLTRQEIIAAQRRATQANQRAILTTQTNSVRGVDVLLPGNVMLRSSRYEVGDKMRYSYVQPDGETYDISDIIEEEWQEGSATGKNDLLDSMLVRSKDGYGDKLDRVLNKIKSGEATRQRQRESVSQASFDSQGSFGSVSPSEYSIDNRSRSATPGSAGLASRAPNDQAMYTSRSKSPSTSGMATPRPGTVTPTAKLDHLGPNRRNPSIASVVSDTTGYATPTTQFSPIDSPRKVVTPKPYNQRKRVVIPKDDFGLSRMMAVIEVAAMKPKEPLPHLDPVDKLLFGRPIEPQSLHPQIRDIYATTFRELEDFDKVLDDHLFRIQAIAAP
ncbi:hypothetical protein BDN71DRAFT_1443663 [Pleurotus eryngii]|uniref:SH3 domain-containing protein n=1 Tax=Pleurotus eryngii TaxID=5323 RepID=A0A9P6A2C8_PLEER|nr:hypothetical protein BDN71DRAFT_1443663 [Pleurotus eryngii]